MPNFMDEPTAGLDVMARESILNLFREYMEEDGERTILISSHISSDLEGLCDDIYMIHEGRIIFHEDTDVLLNQYGLLKVDEKQFEELDKRYLLKKRKEHYGYACLTKEKQYYIENYPDIPLQKFDSYATAKEAFENGTSVAWANDNTEVIAFSLQNDGYTVGIPSLGSADTIAPAVTKGNTTLLDWINEEIKSLGEENFFHADYEATLTDTYGSEYEESLVVEGGVTDAE